MLMAIMQCSKLQFLFANEQKQLARVLPESSAVICARFGKVLVNYMAICAKLHKKAFWFFFSKKNIIRTSTNFSPINQNLKLSL